MVHPGTPQPALPVASQQDWREVLSLLDTALDLDPEAQSDWLAALAPGQQRLSPLLRKLLDARSLVGTGDFMRAPPTFAFDAAAVLPAGTAGPAAGTLVGPYRLLRQIGHGGMASVWLAERADGLLDRQVALKLPHLSWGATTFAAHMARERNILASLTHPNIARLYDAGLDAEGRPFLALEYVAGQPIDAYAAALTLSPRSRVELIVQVARALAHAHSRLIVHRDLKPSNILVDTHGQTHLLDFGIAKLVDPLLAGDGALTQAAGHALTPDYASPEQIRGETIGTASDVYSLGVVMFELLTGERPYRLSKGLGAAALAQALAQTVLPRASSTVAEAGLRRQIVGDLDAILARTLAPDAGDRYPTMDALADDLQRHLRGEPVQARRASRWYLAERWLRKHKLEAAIGAAIVIAVPAGAAAQAAVLTAIAAGAAVALWQARRARQQARLAQDEAARAAAVKGFLTSFFKSGSLDEEGGAMLGRLSVQQFVERGARLIDAGFEHQPAVKAELLDVVSTLFADLSDGAATADYARKWQRALADAGATPTERARAAQRLAQGLSLLGRHADAAALLAPHIATLRARSDATAAAVLAGLLLDQARRQRELGDMASALAGVDEALALPGGSDPAGNTAAAAHFLRAELTAQDNRLAEAVPMFEDALQRLARLHGQRSMTVARHRFTYGWALAAGSQDGAAEVQFKQSLALLREAGVQGELNAAIVELQLGRRWLIAGYARTEGLALLNHARVVFAARAADVSPIHAAQANLYLAEALIDDGDFEGAREPMNTAAQLFRERVENAGQRSVAQLMHARYLSEIGDYDAADRLLEQTRADRERLFGARHPATATVVNRIGLNHLRKRDFDRATAAFVSVLDSDDQGDEDAESAKHMARRNLAATQLAAGDIATALPALQRAYDAHLALPAATRSAMSEAAHALVLGRAVLESGQPAGALPLLQRAVGILAPVYPISPGLATARCTLGLCLLALGEVVQARQLEQAAAAALQAQPSAGPHYRWSLQQLQQALAEQAQETPPP